MRSASGPNRPTAACGSGCPFRIAARLSPHWAIGRVRHVVVHRTGRRRRWRPRQAGLPIAVRGCAARPGCHGAVLGWRRRQARRDQRVHDVCLAELFVREGEQRGTRLAVQFAGAALGEVRPRARLDELRGPGRRGAIASRDGASSSGSSASPATKRGQALFLGVRRRAARPVPRSRTLRTPATPASWTRSTGRRCGAARAAVRHRVAPPEARRCRPPRRAARPADATARTRGRRRPSGRPPRRRRAAPACLAASSTPDARRRGRT